MRIFVVVASVLYAAALAFLLWVTHSRRKLYAPAKGIVSTLFVATGAVSFLLGARSSLPDFLLLFFALLLCALGDVLLGVANHGKGVHTKMFLYGAGSFTLAHIAFIAQFTWCGGWQLWDIALPLLLLFILFTFEHRDLVRLKKLRPLAYIYTALVGLMYTKAVQMLVVLPPAAGVLTSLGALLFLLSDIVLLFLYFGRVRRKWHRYVNLITYYLGVFLLSLTTFWH